MRYSNLRSESGAALRPLGLLSLAVLCVFVAAPSQPGASAWAQSNPVPLINQPLVPDAAAPGSPSFTLTVNGTGFVQGAVVQWNGTALATTFVSGSQLTATVPAANLGTPNTGSVTVLNPGTGTASNVAALQVTVPGPAIGLSTFANLTATSGYLSYTSAADFNRDGRLDLAICQVNGTASNVLIYLGNGDGSFQTPTGYPVPDLTSPIVVGDFNGDGSLDLATNASGNLYVLLGNGDGSFRTAQNEGPSSSPWMAVGDFNGDGRLDLASVNDATDQVAILLGNGDGTFQAPNYYETGSFSEGLAIGDFNRDGKLDLAVSARLDGAVAILLGNGDGTFQNFVEYPTAAAPDVIATADFNGDGILDLTVGTIGPAYSVLLGNGDGTFASHVDYTVSGSSTAYLILADFNGDRSLDVAMAGEKTASLVALGNANGTFRSAGHFMPGGGLKPYYVVEGDFNGDGRPDLVTDDVGNDVSVMLQVSSVVFPTIVNFPQTRIHSSSGPISVTLKNVGGTSFSLSKIGIGGAGSSDFSQSNNCPANLSPGASCSIEVTFTPLKTGLLGATLSVKDSANYSAQFVTLTGVGTQ